mgnify:FL=1
MASLLGGEKEMVIAAATTGIRAAIEDVDFSF